jgi:FkbM family methyltransferase
MRLAESARGIVSRNPTVTRFAVSLYGRGHGFTVQSADGRISVTDPKGKRRVVLNAQHAVYARDVIDDFDFYFEAVEPALVDAFLTVDYSAPREHRVQGWDLMPIEFPSSAEPLVTARQYLDFADLRLGQTAIDLGAYSGFTSLLFQEAVGGSGRVVAVEADTLNLVSLRKNIDNFQKRTATAPVVAELAVWSHNRGIEFLVEGNMGSAAASLMKRGKKRVRQVPSSTLSDLCQRFELDDVHFIKADIEGAELEAFSDREFFRDRHPKIIFEAAASKDHEPKAVIALLEQFGYTCRIRDQVGSRMPLVECL